MDLISAADYARHAGISKAAVSKQIANGRIPVYGPTGEKVGAGDPGKKLINAAEADRARSQTRIRANVADEEPGTGVSPRAEDTTDLAPVGEAGPALRRSSKRLISVL